MKTHHKAFLRLHLPEVSPNGPSHQGGDAEVLHEHILCQALLQLGDTGPEPGRPTALIWHTTTSMLDQRAEAAGTEGLQGVTGEGEEEDGQE